MTEKFIKWLEKQIGSIYVWGAQGEFNFNEAWIRKMEPNEKNADRAVALWKKRIAEGREYVAAYDCSGLVVRFLLDNKLIHSDMTAKGIYSICTPVKRDMLSPGCFVFRCNDKGIHHIGVYVGDNMVIHSKGRDSGVVKEHIDVNGESYWNRYAKYDMLFNAVSGFPCIMTYKGDTYVNLRSTASAQSAETVIDKISKDEQVLALGIANSGWAEVIKHCKDKGTYKRGFCISKHLKKA